MQSALLAPVDEDRGFIACLRVVGDLLFAIGGTHREPTLLASADGRHVHPCVAPKTTGLRGGIAGRDGRLWVVGEYGLIAVSADQGLTWKEVASGTRGCLHGIERNARGELVVFGEKGFVLTSPNDGKTWRRLKLKVPSTVLRVTVLDGEDLFLRSDGKITIWDGKRGVTVATGFATRLTGCVEANNGALWLVGDKGACATSADRGRTWRKVNLPTKATWEAIARVGGVLLIVGTGGHALLSKDDGASFRPIKTGTDEHLWAICAVDGGAFVGGESGLIVRIEDPAKPIWAKRKDTLATRPGPDDGHFAGDLTQFLAKKLAGFLEAKPGSASQLNDFAPVWGQKPPADLVSLTKAFAKPKRGLHEWRYKDGGLPNPEKKKNLFELIVVRDQKNYLGTGLFEAFAGLHFVGYQGNGDYYLIEVFPRGKSHQIIHFDHETFGLSPFADSANALALLTSASAAQEEVRLSTATWKKVLEFLGPRVSPTWHFGSVLGKSKLRYEGDNAVAERAWRCRWLIYLFRQDGVQTIEDIPELFDARFNPRLTEELYREVKPRIHIPPTALMLLWRAFFFDDKVWLDRMLVIAHKSKSRLVRDAGLLVEELLGGRKKLGKIADIHELKRSFQAHDLDPSREEARAAERKASAKEAVSEKKKAASQIKEAASRGDDLVELAWSTLGDSGAQEALWKTVRALPWMADPMRRLDWLAADSWHRENRILKHEEEEVIEVFLAQLSDEALALLVPLWVGHAFNDAGWHRSLRLLRDVARQRTIDPRAATTLRPLLAEPARYDHRRQRVLWVLGAMKDRESVDAIVKLLDVAKPTAGPYYLDFGDAEDLTKAAFWALSEIGDKRAGEAVLAKLRKWGKTANRMNVYMGRAIGKIGDESAIEVLLDLSTRLHDENNHDRGVTEMLWAAARLGAGASAKQKKEWVARLPPVSKHRDNINLARDLALRAFTGKSPASLAAAVTEALTELPGAASWDLDRVRRALRALRETDLPVSLAVPFTWGEDLVFRQLAHDVLASRGEKHPRAATVDLFALDGTSDDELARMLQDERLLFRSRIVDHAAEKKRTALRPAIVGRIRDLMKVFPTQQRDLPTELEYALFWAVKALIALGLDAETRALFNELLRHPNRNVKDPVMRFAPADRALEPGMKHVLEENWAWQAKAARDWLKKK